MPEPCYICGSITTDLRKFCSRCGGGEGQRIATLEAQLASKQKKKALSDIVWARLVQREVERANRAEELLKRWLLETRTIIAAFNIEDLRNDTNDLLNE